MWSDRYNYYNIQSDEGYTKKVETGIVLQILLKSGYFLQKDHQTLVNAENFPWLEMVLAETEDGSFATSDKKLPYVNLIAVVCTKSAAIDQGVYLKAFLEMAEELNWKLYLEEDDEGNENIEIR
ncbi:hypothetical protein SAMN05421820_105248 [Pedobacter steynii]|uniref:Uncharacterized protein n=1 Tax=Pedobacter steynii TaxID=430522 RepID=A0A1G9WRU9_9SPHI|nr:hypothetical protein [Pedobacter steynii]NQX40368.1 hypothetical protein [Pedobacter steynii]SDM86856.1 hypothetical protein SAMN05421820_105248 [Pedobacter steynii]